MNVVRKNERTMRRLSIVAATAAGVALLMGLPQLATAAPQPPPYVPAEVAVPDGNVVSRVGYARGFQIYGCQALATGHGWVLSQPMAVLTDNGHKPVALHYGGPSWTAMNDGSTVVATKDGSAPAPFGDAIPWLRLKATSNSGPAGGEFTAVTYILRINTTGGLAPTTGCDATSVGTTSRVAYTADYYFYRAA